MIRSQWRWYIIVLFAPIMTEVMIARIAAGQDVGASRGVGIKIGTAITDMTLPLGRVW